jgi:hypothetical protein
MKATPVTKRRLFPKGAEWRRWDLHFHSPASYDYQNKSSKPAEIIESLVKAKIEALAVTDHPPTQIRVHRAALRTRS